MSDFRLITHRGIVSYVGQDNIDTDIIIPKQFLVTTTNGNLGRHSFQQWREQALGGCCFFLCQKPFAKTSVLVVRRNFGCGSSREHAPWSLRQCGFRVLIGISFAEIFYLNCIRNGLLPVTLKEYQIEELRLVLSCHTRANIVVNLLAKTVLLNGLSGWAFQLASLYKVPLIRGSTNTSLTLKHVTEVLKYERLLKTPFLPN